MLQHFVSKFSHVALMWLFIFLIPGTKDKPAVAPSKTKDHEDNRNLSSGPQRLRPQPTQAKTVTFNPQPPVAHEQKYAPINSRQVPPPAPGYGLLPQDRGPGVIKGGARNPVLNPHPAGLSKVPMQSGQPRLNPVVAGGIRVLPAHGRLPQVNLPNTPIGSYSGGSSNGEDNEDASEADSDLSQELAREGCIVYGRFTDQGRIRTSNV